MMHLHWRGYNNLAKLYDKYFSGIVNFPQLTNRNRLKYLSQTLMKHSLLCNNWHFLLASKYEEIKLIIEKLRFIHFLEGCARLAYVHYKALK